MPNNADAATAARLLATLLRAPPAATPSKRVHSGKRGVSAAFLHAFCDFFAEHGGGTAFEMATVCKGEGLVASIVKLTASTGLSLVESCMLVADRDEIDTGGLFGHADAFFSYPWEGTRLGHARHAVARAAAKMDQQDGSPARFWIDIFCAPQAMHSSLEDMEGIYGGAVQATHTLVFYASPLLDEWTAPRQRFLSAEREACGSTPSPWVRSGPHSTTRAWCLLELAEAVHGKRNVMIALNPAEEDDLGRILTRDIEKVAAMVGEIDTLDLQLSKVEDRHFILGRVENLPEGYTSLYKLATLALRDWLAASGRVALEAAEVQAARSMALEDLKAMWGLQIGLAKLLQILGRYEEAEDLFWRTLRGREVRLGASHGSTLTVVSTLAGLLRAQGKYDASEPLYRRALHGYEAELGTSHPHTLVSVNNLAMFVFWRGRPMEAIALKLRRSQLDGVLLGMCLYLLLPLLTAIVLYDRLSTWIA